MQLCSAEHLHVDVDGVGRKWIIVVEIVEFSWIRDVAHNKETPAEVGSNVAPIILESGWSIDCYSGLV